MPQDVPEKTAQERAALVAWHLAHGEAMTIYNVIDLTGLGYEGARTMMYALSRVLPIYYDDGCWVVAYIRESG